MATQEQQGECLPTMTTPIATFPSQRCAPLPHPVGRRTVASREEEQDQPRTRAIGPNSLICKKHDSYPQCCSVASAADHVSYCDDTINGASPTINAQAAGGRGIPSYRPNPAVFAQPTVSPHLLPWFTENLETLVDNASVLTA